MSPSIRPSAKVRGSRAPIFFERRGHFRNAVAGKCRPDHHFAGELHAGCRELECENAVADAASQTTIEIPDLDCEKQTAEKADDWIAEEFVQGRHGPRRDAAAKPIADDAIGAGSMLFAER